MRLSATKLESFRLYKTADWMTYERLIEQLIGKPPSPQELYNMRRGRALHKIFEESEKHRSMDQVSVFVDGKEFTFHGLFEYWPMIPIDGIPELKIETEIDGLELVAVVDHIIGLKGLEYKTTKRFDLSKYEESAQWKFLIYLFGLQELEYQVYTIKDEYHGTVIQDFNQFSVFRYPNLERDLFELIGEFCEFIKLRKLEKYFEPKGVAV